MTHTGTAPSAIDSRMNDWGPHTINSANSFMNFTFRAPAHATRVGDPTATREAIPLHLFRTSDPDYRAFMLSAEATAGLQAELLATGKIRNGLSITATGPTEITYRRVSLQPSGFTGWHYHPGPVAVVVKSGVLTRMFCDGSSEVSGPGESIIEPAGPEHVHAGCNRGDVPVVLYMVYFIPHGAEHAVATEVPPIWQPSGIPAPTGLETAA